MIAGPTGLMLHGARKPDPPGLPTLRAFQSAHAWAGIALLKHWNIT